MDKPLYRYRYIHEPTEVIMTVIASTPLKAMQAINEQVDSSPFTFPEGKWAKIGVVPCDEVW